MQSVCCGCRTCFGIICRRLIVLEALGGGEYFDARPGYAGYGSGGIGINHRKLRRVADYFTGTGKIF
jgi:hypothetical protein